VQQQPGCAALCFEPLEYFVAFLQSSYAAKRQGLHRSLVLAHSRPHRRPCPWRPKVSGRQGRESQGSPAAGMYLQPRDLVNAVKYQRPADAMRHQRHACSPGGRKNQPSRCLQSWSLGTAAKSTDDKSQRHWITGR
jgi:hypothetical protein